jgi:hypothetical protein
MGLLLLGVEAGESSRGVEQGGRIPLDPLFQQPTRVIVTNRGIRAKFYAMPVADCGFLANIRTPKGVSSL